MAKILIVEDDEMLGLSVLTALESRKHVVELVSNGIDALEFLRNFDYEVVILDWGIPQLNGLEVLQKYRQKNGNAVILMLTGKSDIRDKEIGFETGADDYLTKPFDMRELIARVDGLLRRARTFKDDVLSFKGVELSIKTKNVLVDGVEVSLSAMEIAVLEYLMRRPDQYFTVDDLLSGVWQSASESSEHAVRQCISRLRSKLDRPGREAFIRTTKGLGYRIDSGRSIG
ncbi:MAG: response regulator transcription factor [Candidatus Melainabacteria bacterium]|nr:MAG: response regulator transcription factor [Candidatus Melainabacteria bacterium]